VPSEHVENADTQGADTAQNEPLPIDPLENTIGGKPAFADSTLNGEVAPRASVAALPVRRCNGP
jgi:hypothetical protein